MVAIEKMVAKTTKKFNSSSNYDLYYGQPGSKFRTEQDAKELLIKLSIDPDIEYNSLSYAETYAAQYLESQDKITIYFGEDYRKYIKRTPILVQALLKILPLQ